MIKSFKCADTQALFSGKRVRRFVNISRVAERKLQMLAGASGLDDLVSPPGNQLEPLHKDREGLWSIRINKQFRICFRFESGNAYDVEIVDYH